MHFPAKISKLNQISAGNLKKQKIRTDSGNWKTGNWKYQSLIIIHIYNIIFSFKMKRLKKEMKKNRL